MIPLIDRSSSKPMTEKIYGEKALQTLYGVSKLPLFFQRLFLWMVSSSSFASSLVGLWQKAPWTKKNVLPFIESFDIDTSEFERPPEKFSSFNDFFIRTLKPRNLSQEEAILPADARYRFFQNLNQETIVDVKGRSLSLAHLLQDPLLAQSFEGGSLVSARLAPPDYHRFHFPCDGVPSLGRMIQGKLYSVNPIATWQNVNIFSENKRMLIHFETGAFGKMAIVAVGATSVGSIHMTYEPGKKVKKGDEMGYFSFGGSQLFLLFQPNTIRFDQDLLDLSCQSFEIRALMGQSLGTPLI